jgi:hypothetical protein
LRSGLSILFRLLARLQAHSFSARKVKGAGVLHFTHRAVKQYPVAASRLRRIQRATREDDVEQPLGNLARWF